MAVLTSLVKSSLNSRSLRSALTKGSGTRVANLSALFNPEKDKNLLSRFWGAITGGVPKLFNFIGGTLEWLGVAGRSIGGWVSTIFSGGVKALLTFNWNESDADIKENIKQNNVSLAETWGETLGFAVCSGVTLGVTALIPNIGPIVAKMAAPDVAQEIVEETMQALRQTVEIAAENFAYMSYMNVRSFLKSSELVHRLIRGIPGFGEKLDSALTSWGTGEPWTIHGAITKKIEAMPDKTTIQALVKGATEGFYEGCLEGYYQAVAIVSMRLDDYLASQKALQQNVLGAPRTVTINVKGDPENPDPPVQISGPQKMLVPVASAAIAQLQFLATRDIGSVYSQPATGLQERVAFLPQVSLRFQENQEDVERGYSALEAEITFRLVDETSETWTEEKSERLAKKIRDIFAVPRYRFQKGQAKVTYRDRALGYQLTAFVSTESIGEDFFQKILQIQGHTFDPAKFSRNKLGKTLPTVPEKKLIYGKTRRLPRQRPTGWVVFNNAQLHLWALAHPIILVDCSRKKRKALIRA